MKIAGTVILYYPEDIVHQNISSYLPHLDLLIINDNSEPNAHEFLARYGNNPKILILKNDENEGIARPLNKAAEIAIEKNCNWLLTMDQDSAFPEGMFTLYLECFRGLINKEEFGACGVNTINNTTGNENCISTMVSTVITSGTLVNLHAFSASGPFDERLFIDGVDDEYCFRLQQKGYSILRFENIMLQHRLGNEVMVRNFKIGSRVKRNVFSPIRLYYMMRNYHLILKKYGNAFPEQRKKYNLELWNKGKNSILYGPALKTIGYLIKGYRDFLFKRFGKYQ